MVTSGLRRGIFTAFLTARAFLTPVAFGVCALVEDEAGRILLVRHRYSRGWGLPGGGVGRCEPPALALLRELAEEVGLTGAQPPEMFGLYTRSAGWATNVVALYRVRGGLVRFRPNLEISAVRFADPADPPSDIASAAARRLAELRGAPRSHYW